MQQSRVSFFLMVALCLPVMMACVDIMAVSVALHNIMTTFNVNVVKVQYLLSAYTIGTAALFLLFGRLADKYGRKKLFIIGVTAFGVASLFAAIANSFVLLLFARLIQGISSSIMMTATVAVISHTHDNQVKINMLIRWGGALGFAMAMGPFFGGLILTIFNWRGIFLINIPLSIMAILLIHFYVEESRSNKTIIINWFQAMSLALFFISISILAVELKLHRIESLTNLFIILVSVLALICYLINLVITKSSLVNYDLFKIENYFVASHCGAISYFCMYAWLFVMTLYLRNVFHLSALLTGIVCSSFSIAFALTASLVKKLILKYNSKILIFSGFFIIVISFGSMLHINTTTSILYLVFSFALLGMGVMITNSLSMTMANEFIPLNDTGSASGIIFTIRWIGGTLGIISTSILYQYLLHRYQSRPSLPLHIVFEFLGLIASVGCLFSLIGIQNKGKLNAKRS